MIKTAYYYRARRDAKPFDLQAIMGAVRKLKPTVADSEITFGGGEILRIQSYRVSNGCTFIQLVKYEPGVAAATLLPNATTEEGDEVAQLAPRGREFKDGDCFLLLKQHHVLFCAHGISLPKASVYLGLLFRDAGLEKKTTGFDLTPASNIDKLELIQQHGVKSLLLTTSAYQLSLPKAQRNKWVSKVLGKLGDELGALIEKDDTPADQKALEDLQVNLEISLDGNTRAAQDSQAFIKQLAEGVMDESDTSIGEFVILTQKNEKVTASDIRLQAPIKVEKQNNSIAPAAVRRELERYLSMLEENSFLEQ